jgi:hypothetical protein
MLNVKVPKKVVLTTFVMGITLGVYFGASGSSVFSSAVAEEAATAESVVSPVKARERDYYSPNSESLAADEMRVIACGTGMPTTRAAQAAACFLVELGNGDKFIFDIGSGSAERLSSLQIPYDYLDKKCSSVAHSWAGRSRFASGVLPVALPSSELRMPFRR